MMMGLGWWMVYMAGGTISAITHVMYVPIVLGALAWGPTGGIGGGAIAGGLMALTPVVVATGQMQTLVSVSFRLGAFISVGGLVGYSVMRNRQQQREMRELLIQSVTALTNAMSVTHEQTATHSLRVGEIGARLGQKLRLDEHQLFILRMGGLMHDIGKLAVPLEILDKPGRLTHEEYRMVQEHVTAGAAILDAFDYSRIGAVQDIVRHHHERLDGSGYPDGLKGAEISQLSRIVAVADVYDALTSTRTYRARLSHSDAMVVLRQEAAAGRLDGRLIEMLNQLPRAACGPVEAGVEVVGEAV